MSQSFWHRGVPFECDFDNVPTRPVPTAIGITWVLKEKGDRIVLADQMYLAEKDGATIEFTENGPVLSSITRKKLDKVTANRQAQQGRLVKVVSPRANLMSGRSVLATVAEGDILRVTKEQGDWLWVDSVQSATGTKRGWIHRRHVK